MAFEITPELIALASIVSSVIITVLNMYITTVYGPKFQESWRQKSQKETRIWSQNEERFSNMLKTLEGFYIEYPDPQEALKLRKEFMKEYRQVWLYSSDDAIRKINAFFLSTGYSKNVETVQDKTFRGMVYNMRKTIYGNTALKPEDF
jgi:hypothetical protein